MYALCMFGWSNVQLLLKCSFTIGDPGHHISRKVRGEAAGPACIPNSQKQLF